MSTGIIPRSGTKMPLIWNDANCTGATNQSFSKTSCWAIHVTRKLDDANHWRWTTGWFALPNFLVPIRAVYLPPWIEKKKERSSIADTPKQSFACTHFPPKEEVLNFSHPCPCYPWNDQDSIYCDWATGASANRHSWQPLLIYVQYTGLQQPNDKMCTWRTWVTTTDLKTSRNKRGSIIEWVKIFIWCEK